jgi:hypothetical protein
MTRRATRLFLGNIPVALGDMATCPAGKKWEVIHVNFTHGGAAPSNVNVVISDGVNSASIGFVPAMPLLSQFDRETFHVLNAGDKLRGNTAGQANVNCIITGIEVEI